MYGRQHREEWETKGKVLVYSVLAIVNITDGETSALNLEFMWFLFSETAGGLSFCRGSSLCCFPAEFSSSRGLGAG